MKCKRFDEVWLEVGHFITKHKGKYGHPIVKIYSDYIDILFMVDITLREWPDGADERRIYRNDDHLEMGYSWHYDPDKQ